MNKFKQWSLNGSITIGLILAVILIILMSILSNQTITALNESAKSVAHTREVEYNLSQLTSILLSIEQERQNFLLTGKVIHKQQTDTLFNSLNSVLDFLLQLTSDNSAQQVRLFEIRRLFNQRYELLKSTFKEYELRGTSAITSLLFIQKRAELLDKISSLVKEADYEEKRLYAIREKKTTELAKNVSLISPAGDFAAVLIIIIVFLFLNEEVTRRLKFESALLKSEGKLKNLVAELQQKEDELSNANNRLQLSNEELAQFAYVASHDLQEPLRMISSFTQLLQKRYQDKLDGDANEFINFAVDGATRMQRLINDLLDYSRVSTRGKSFSEIELSKVLDLAVFNLHKKIEETGAVIMSDHLPCAKGDEIQIMRVFQNLIENSIKFRGNEKPYIQILSHVEDSKVIISIKDNGIGIDQKYKDKIFIIFQRLHSTSAYPGTGIGLTICKKIIERHEGKIWFESAPGKGTTFYFTLNK